MKNEEKDPRLVKLEKAFKRSREEGHLEGEKIWNDIQIEAAKTMLWFFGGVTVALWLGFLIWKLFF